MRVLALWFPDWPAQAAPGEPPLAIASGARILTCDAPARQAGVTRGMPVRQARALCPALTVVAHHPERDYREFERVVGKLDDVAASVEVLRPGLVLVDAAATARYYGGEDTAAEMLIDAAAHRHTDALAGIADEIPTAVLAARCSTIVPPGDSRAFLTSLPLSAAAAEVSLDVDAELVEILSRLGVITLGDVARLPRASLITRFGAAGRTLADIATAAVPRRVTAPLPGADYAVTAVPEEPLTRVDAAAFLARRLAAQLHDRLRAAGMVCRRLRVSAETTQGRVHRVWHLREELSESATADRVRWQLDGWLTGGGAGEIVALTLDPIEVGPPAQRSWTPGGSLADDHRPHHAISRVQSLLGPGAVLRPWSVGGRGVAERIELVEYGERMEAAGRGECMEAAGRGERMEAAGRGEHRASAASGDWPGRVPPPLPARLLGVPRGRTLEPAPFELPAPHDVPPASFGPSASFGSSAPHDVPSASFGSSAPHDVPPVSRASCSSSPSSALFTPPAVRDLVPAPPSPRAPFPSLGQLMPSASSTSFAGPVSFAGTASCAGPTLLTPEAYLLAANSAFVSVDADLLLTAVPTTLVWSSARYHVIGWAGPWPDADPMGVYLRDSGLPRGVSLPETPRRGAVGGDRVSRGAVGGDRDSRGGAGFGVTVRVQVVGSDTHDAPHAWLLAWREEAWCVEGVYD